MGETRTHKGKIGMQTRCFNCPASKTLDSFERVCVTRADRKTVYVSFQTKQFMTDAYFIQLMIISAVPGDLRPIEI